jgi:hypothetical protein
MISAMHAIAPAVKPTMLLNFSLLAFRTCPSVWTARAAATNPTLDPDRASDVYLIAFSVNQVMAILT